MNLYLMRSCDAPGNEADTERALSSSGRADAKRMAAFLRRIAGHVDIVLSPPFACAVETGEIVAAEIGSYVATTVGLSPDATVDLATEEIFRLSQASTDVVAVVLDSALLEDPGAYLAPGAIALLSFGVLQWLVTPLVVEVGPDEETVLESAKMAAAVIETPEEWTGRITESGKRIFLDEAGEYYYDEQEMKRWNLGSGGASGNCEICEENADLGWVDMDEVFLDSDGGDIDEAPAHPNCDCEVEFKTRRVRVYA